MVKSVRGKKIKIKSQVDIAKIARVNASMSEQFN